MTLEPSPFLPANLMQIGFGVSVSGNTSVIHQAPIPINMLRGPGPGQQHPSQLTYNPNISAYFPRGMCTILSSYFIYCAYKDVFLSHFKMLTENKSFKKGCY